ncbi:MAG TPA: hypothetical protein VEW92_02045 [Nitrososphaeraceae archaeon]|nr:hypothetical protein [Nitrososphaeraceae archaeon]
MIEKSIISMEGMGFEPLTASHGIVLLYRFIFLRDQVVQTNELT